MGEVGDYAADALRGAFEKHLAGVNLLETATGNWYDVESGCACPILAPFADEVRALVVQPGKKKPARLSQEKIKRLMWGTYIPFWAVRMFVAEYDAAVSFGVSVFDAVRLAVEVPAQAIRKAAEGRLLVPRVVLCGSCEMTHRLSEDGSALVPHVDLMTGEPCAARFEQFNPGADPEYEEDEGAEDH